MCRWKDRTSVQRHLSNLIELGEIKSVPRFRDNGSKTSNEYQFTAFEHAAEQRHGGRSAAARDAAQQRLPLNSIEPSVEPSGSTSVDKTEKSLPESEQQVREYCVSLGLPESDGSYMWDHWHGNGFTYGHKKIKDWKAVIRTWQRGGYLPSLKKPKYSELEPKYYTDGLGRRMKITAENKQEAEYYLSREFKR